MLRRLTVIAALLLVSVACTGDDDPPARPATPPAAEGVCDGSGRNELTVDDAERAYFAYVPQGWDGERAMPVMYFFHGLGGQADTTLAYTELAERADEHGFVVIAPQAAGTESEWDVRGSVEAPGSDLAFVRELTEQVGAQECIDEDRQFAAGLSNGSAMTFALACSGEFPFRGYAGVAAIFYEASCDAAPPAPIVYFHGTADAVVPFNGGPTPLEPVRPAPESMTQWAEHSGCDPDFAEETIGEDVEHIVWSGCGDAPVEGYAILGGGHTWPGASNLAGFGAVTETIEASDVIVDFFELDAER